jgi:hypothetical protein
MSGLSSRCCQAKHITLVARPGKYPYHSMSAFMCLWLRASRRSSPGRLPSRILHTSLCCAQSARQGLTLVHLSAQLEPCLTHKNTLHPLYTT